MCSGFIKKLFNLSKIFCKSKTIFFFCFYLLLFFNLLKILLTSSICSPLKIFWRISSLFFLFFDFNFRRITFDVLTVGA